MFQKAREIGIQGCDHVIRGIRRSKAAVAGLAVSTAVTGTVVAQDLLPDVGDITTYGDEATTKLATVAGYVAALALGLAIFFIGLHLIRKFLKPRPNG